MRVSKAVLSIGLVTICFSGESAAFDLKSLTDKIQKGVEDSIQQGVKEKTDKLIGNKPKSQGTQPGSGSPHQANPKKNKVLVKQTQQRLNALGYNTGTPDGVFGNKTAAAINAFQKDQGIPVTGAPSQALLTKLNKTTAPASPSATAALSGLTAPTSAAATAQDLVQPLAGKQGLQPIRLKKSQGGVYTSGQNDIVKAFRNDFSRWVDFIALGRKPNIIEKFPKELAFRHLVASERNSFLKCRYQHMQCKNSGYFVWRGANEFARSDTLKTFLALYGPKIRSSAVTLPVDVTWIERVSVQQYSKSERGFKLTQLPTEWHFHGGAFRIKRPYQPPTVWPIDETAARQIVDALEKQSHSSLSTRRQAYLVTRFKIMGIGPGEPRIPFTGTLETKLKDAVLYRTKALNQELHRFKLDKVMPQQMASSVYGPDEVTLIAHLVKKAGKGPESVDWLVRRLNHGKNEFEQREAIEIVRKKLQQALTDVVDGEHLSFRGRVYLGSYDFDKKHFPVKVSSINAETGDPWEILPRQYKNQRYVGVQPAKKDQPPFKVSPQAAQQLLKQLKNNRTLEARFLTVASGGKIVKGGSNTVGNLQVKILRTDLLPPGKKASSDATALVSLGSADSMASAAPGSGVPAPPPLPGGTQPHGMEQPSNPFALAQIPKGAYGPDIVRIRLGMSLSQAEQLVRSHMAVSQVLIAKNEKSPTEGYGSAKLFTSKDGNELIVLYGGPPNAANKLVGLVRWMKRPTGSLPKDAVFNKLRGKFGKEAYGQHSWLSWAENGNGSGPCLIHYAPTKLPWRDSSGNPASGGDALGDVPGLKWDARKADLTDNQKGYEICGPSVFAGVETRQGRDELIMRLYDQRAYSAYMLNARQGKQSKTVDLKL